MVNIVCYWTFLILVAASKAQDNEETTAVAISSGDLTEDKCNTSVSLLKNRTANVLSLKIQFRGLAAVLSFI